MWRSLPVAARALLWVRLLNQLGAFALAFLAVLAGPHLVTAALVLFGLAALVSRWAGGILLDRAPPRTLIVAGLFATGAALLALALARTPAQTLACVVATGLAFEIYEPATNELLARVISGPERRHAYAVLGTSLTAAGAVSGLLAAALLPLGVRWLLAADAATCVAAGVVASLRLPRWAPPVRVARTRWRPPVRLVRLTVSATAFAFGYLGVLMYLPLVLLQRGAAAWLPGLALTCAALLTPLGAHVTRRVPPRALLLAGGPALGCLTLTMATADGTTTTLAAYLGWSFAAGALLGHWPATAADDAPEPDRPRWFAFVGLSWGIAQPAVPAVAGLTGGGLHAAGLAFLILTVL